LKSKEAENVSSEKSESIREENEVFLLAGQRGINWLKLGELSSVNEKHENTRTWISFNQSKTA